MDAKEILVIGVKGEVLAFDRNSGNRLWQTKIAGGLTGSGFVSVIADERLVFAHAKGELFCLDLMTGRLLWKDGLSGLGYGLASLALPNGPVAPAAALMQEIRQREQQSSDSSTQSHTQTQIN